MNNREEIESIQLANWLRMNKYTFTHISNESWLPPKIAMLSAIKKKKQWVSPGVPDYMIILKTWWILFIELKRTLVQSDYRKDWKLLANAPKASKEQEEWIAILDSIDNIECKLVYGVKNAIDMIKEYDKI